jgi:cell division septum initiation protein DivIVA
VGEAMLDAHKAGQALKAEAEAEAEEVRAEAEALGESARQEAQRLVAEARAQANEIVSDAEAERQRLAAEAEQYKLLASDVHRRSIEFLRRGLEALGGDPADSDASPEEDVAPFRRPDQQAAGE